MTTDAMTGGLAPESTSRPGGLVCARCGRSDGTFEAWGSTVTHFPCEIDVWTTTQGRWRLAVDEWLRRRSAPPEALSVEQRPSGDVSGDVPFGNLTIPTALSGIDPPAPDEPCPDELAGNAATAGVSLDPVAAPTTEVLQ